MTDKEYKEYLIGKFMIREGNMMGYYDVILRPSDYKALEEGKVSFTEVDEELEQKKKESEADAATSTPQDTNTIWLRSVCSHVSISR